MSATNNGRKRPDYDPLPEGAIWTPEIERLGQKVALWARLDLPGAMVKGKNRVGKSAAGEYLLDTLSSLMGYPVDVLLWEIEENCADSPHGFVQGRMIESGYSAINHRNVEILKNRFFTFIKQRCEEKNTRRLIVIIDEAQNIKRPHFGYLVEYFNRITKLGLKPFFLLIGQPELSDTVNWQGVDGRDMQIVGRFRVNQYHFRGIALGDLKEVLREFDRPGPEGPPPSLTAYLPEAYANGWCIADIVPALREALGLVMQQHNLREDLRVPMQYLRSTVGAFLHHVAETGENPAQASSATLIKCLKECGFLSVLTNYVETTTDDGEDAA